MNQKVISALQRIKDEYGPDIFDNTSRVKGLLADFLQNEYTGDRHLLLLVLDAGILKKMLSGYFFSESELLTHASYISKKFYFQENAVISALKCWQNTISSLPDSVLVHKIQIISDQPQGVNARTIDAESLFRIAEQGRPWAQNALGEMYENGRDVPKDETQAVAWYRKAADQDYTEGLFNVGRCYYDAIGVPEDYAEAIEWFLKAAEQGHSLAQYELGVCYDLGYGVPSNAMEAFKWYLKAAEQGHADAMYDLYMLYICHINDSAVLNERDAFNWFLKAAEHGNINAQKELGYKYENGIDVPQNDVEAAKWYLKAAEQGDIEEQSRMAKWFEEGRGVLQNDAEAAKWYLKAAEQMDSDAQYQLGLCYEEGRGVSQSYEEAIQWYLKSLKTYYSKDAENKIIQLAELGNKIAQFAMGSCAENGLGRGGHQSYEEAAKWYLKAAEQGHPKALYKLGYYYENGIVVTRNVKEAVKWYSKAAEQGYPGAAFKLENKYGIERNNEIITLERIGWKLLTRELNRNIPDTELLLKEKPQIIEEDDIIDVLTVLKDFYSSIKEIPSGARNFFHRLSRGRGMPRINIGSLLQSAFPNLKMRAGFVLDYIYAWDGHCGEPYLYARPAAERPLINEIEYCRKFGLPPLNLYGHEPNIQNTFPFLYWMEYDFDGTSLFQLAFFLMTGHRFHLYDHSWYNNRFFLLTKFRLEQFCLNSSAEFSKEELDIVKALDPRPKVYRINNFSVVSLLNYEMNRGCSYLHLFFKDRFLVRLEDSVIVANKSTILY